MIHALGAHHQFSSTQRTAHACNRSCCATEQASEDLPIMDVVKGLGLEYHTLLHNRKKLVKAGRTRNLPIVSAIRLFKGGKTSNELRWILLTVAVSLSAASSFGQVPAGTPCYNPRRAAINSSTVSDCRGRAAAGRDRLPGVAEPYPWATVSAVAVRYNVDTLLDSSKIPTL